MEHGILFGSLFAGHKSATIKRFSNMLQIRFKEELKKSRFVLYFLCALSAALVVLILLLIIKWLGTGMPILDPVHVLITAATLIVLGCTYLAWNSIKNMDMKLKSMEKVYLSD